MHPIDYLREAAKKCEDLLSHATYEGPLVCRPWAKARLADFKLCTASLYGSMSTGHAIRLDDVDDVQISIIVHAQLVLLSAALEVIYRDKAGNNNYIDHDLWISLASDHTSNSNLFTLPSPFWPHADDGSTHDEGIPGHSSLSLGQRKVYRDVNVLIDTLENWTSYFAMHRMSVEKRIISTQDDAGFENGTFADLAVSNRAVLNIRSDLSQLRMVKEASYDSHEESGLGRCLKGTRREILHTIRRWAKYRFMEEQVFWLHGSAGSGKSTIARTVAHKLDRQHYFGASFFFQKGDRDRGNTRLFFPTIAYQLATTLPTLDEVIVKALKEDKFLINKDLQEQSNKLLLPLVEQLKQVWRAPPLIVIDGLDQCEQIDDVLLLLGILVRTQVRIFFTSRDKLPAGHNLQFSSRSLDITPLLDEFGNRKIYADLRSYIKKQLETAQQNARYGNFCTGLPPRNWLADETFWDPNDLALDSFILASTICKFVSGSGSGYRCNHEPQSEIDSPYERIRLIYAVTMLSPEDYKATYEIMINFVVPKQAIDKFKDVLRPLYLLASPLQMYSFCSLVGITPADVYEQLEPLHLLFNMSTDRSAFARLPLPSYRDFLAHHKILSSYISREEEVETHRQLLHCCLQLLSHPGSLWENICHVPRPGHRRVEMSQDQVANYIADDIAYACSYWVFHLVQSGDTITENGAVHEFLKHSLLSWLEALGWLGKLHYASSAIKSLLTLVNADRESELFQFLTDANQFISLNQDVINLAPLQVYFSALIFTPGQSMVKSLFLSKYHGSWRGISPTALQGSPPHATERRRLYTYELHGHTNPISAITFSRDGQTLASASRDSTVRVWNLRSGKEIHKLEGHNESVAIIAFSRDGQTLISASVNHAVWIWNLRTGQGIQKLKGRTVKGRVYLKFSPDGQMLATSFHEKIVQLWDPMTGQAKHKLEGHTAVIERIAFSSNGQMLASASRDGTIRLWNTMTGQERHKLEADTCSISFMNFSPDGQTLATQCWEGKMKAIRLWDVVTGEVKFDLGDHTQPFLGMAFSPNGQVLAAVAYCHDRSQSLFSKNRLIRLWNIATGQEIHELRYSSRVTNIAFSPDGQTLAVGADAYSITLWKPTSGETIEEYPRPNSRFSRLTFTPDGKMLVWVDENIVRLCSVAGWEMQIFRRHANWLEL